MALGIVTWFSPQGDFGFIQPLDGSTDVFVHMAEIERAGLTVLREGQRVRYEAILNHGKQTAEHLSLAE